MEQYKHGLFDGPNSPGHLKTEMHRLAMGISDVVEVLSEGENGGGGRQGDYSQDCCRQLSESWQVSTSCCLHKLAGVYDLGLIYLDTPSNLPSI